MKVFTPVDSQRLCKLVVDAIDDLKGHDIVELDVHTLTDFCDHMVIASGRSGRHIRSLAENIVAKAKAAGVQPMGMEGMDEGEWVLVDLCDVVVHVMQPDARTYYELEKLWTPMSPVKSGADSSAATTP